MRPAYDVRFSYSSLKIFLGLGDDKFAETLVVFTPRWYAIDTFSDALCKLRPVYFPEIPARFLHRRDFGISKPIVIMLGLCWLFGECGSMVRVVGMG